MKNSDGLLINGGSSYEPSRQSSAIVSEASRIQRIQEYFIELKTLGRGQFGKVLKCQNRTDLQNYAVKVTHAMRTMSKKGPLKKRTKNVA